MIKGLNIDSRMKKRLVLASSFIVISAVIGIMIYFLAVYDASAMYVRSAEEFDAIVTDGMLTPPEKIKTLKIKGNFTIESLTVERPISLSFAGNIQISDEILFKISDEPEDAVTIDTSRNSEGLIGRIRFESPLTSVIWEGEGAPDFEYAQQYMNVKSFNQEPTDSMIGGSGDCRLISCTLTDYLGREATFTADGNYSVAALGYADSIDLASSEIRAELSDDGTYKLAQENGGYYVVVTDAQSKDRGYRIEIDSPEYHLPVIHITTENRASIASKNEYIAGSFSIDYNGFADFENLSDVKMGVRGRGHSSWKLEKKPYKIKFNKKTSLFGLTAAKNWVLQANHVDKSLMRNNLAMSISSVLDNMVFVPHSYMVDVFVNGQYQGVYSLCEQIEIKNGRIVGEEDSNDVMTDYLLEVGGAKTSTSFGDNTFKTDLFPWVVEIKSPDADILTYDQYTYIKNYVTSADRTVKAYGNYEQYLDLPSLIDWFIINELAYNTDCTMRRSVFLFKKKDGKLFMASPWDYDYAFGNMAWDDENYDGWICNGNEITDADNYYIKPNWFSYLLKDKNFQEKLKERWNEVKGPIYQTAMETIEKNQRNIGISAKENYTVWSNCLGVKMQYESPLTAEIGTYEEQVEYLKSFVDKRYHWMDDTINAM